MNTSNHAPQYVTWEELVESISTGAAHTEETHWKIYRYLQQNYKTMGSVMARTLLAAYIKLHIKRMSLVDSCILGMAVRISETYADFKFPLFLEAWGYDGCLRGEDLRGSTGKDGRQYPALKERVERALRLYMQRHPEESDGQCGRIARRLAGVEARKVVAAVVGFVDCIDNARGQVHIYDSQSRHFVADMSACASLNIKVGMYVRLNTTIYKHNRVNTAVVIGVMDKYEGRKAFGIYEAKVEYVDTTKMFLRYSIVSAIRYTPEGNIIKAGFASTASLPDDERRSVVQNSHVRLVLFLKEGRDGVKRNYVAELF